ncbi:MAG: hypothetical protein QOC78_487 [Solirubrobacteraceae bacterium]|jgi:hypothetical protein|nr:hypothetical protein [Solirubrobacteraceae bacterium]
MRPLALLLAAAALAAPAAADAADQVVATVDTPTRLSAYGSGLLWSQRDPETGSFWLFYTEALSPPHALPVAERSVPFDADLGPGPGGHFLAVYSRCEIEPAYDPVDAEGPPDYSLGRGCDLYQLDVTTGRETKVANASSPRADETLPTVWKDGIAFVRRYPDRALPIVYARSRTGSEPSRRMPGGPHDHGRATALDLYGRRLAVAWTFRGRYLGPASDLRLVDTTSRDVTYVDRFAGGGLTTIARDAPAFEAGQLYYGRVCQGDPGGCRGRSGLVRVRYSTSGAATAPIGDTDLWQARGEGVTYVLRDRSPFRACREPQVTPLTATCRIVATTPAYG